MTSPPPFVQSELDYRTGSAAGRAGPAPRPRRRGPPAASGATDR